MKDDNQDNRPRTRYVRFVVLPLAALLVLSLGLAFSPPEPVAPPEPPFSEQARAAAFEEAMRLRSSGQELAASAAAQGMPAEARASLDQAVTLLTFHARVLLYPAGPTGASSPGASAPATPPASASSTPDSTSSAAPASRDNGPGPSGPQALAMFAAALAASGQQRLADAETADGGMARLLAGTGTAQVLAAEQLDGPPAGPRGNTAGTPPATAGPTPTSPCPATTSINGNGLGAALAAASAAEREAVYGYQAALPRLSASRAGPAADFTARHQDLAGQAAASSLQRCGIPPMRPPGYVLDPAFLAAPEAGLAGLETDLLPVYGDIVGVAGGAARSWALATLQETARRAQYWGAEPAPVPGLVLDGALLPLLPR